LNYGRTTLLTVWHNDQRSELFNRHAVINKRGCRIEQATDPRHINGVDGHRRLLNCRAHSTHQVCE